MCWFHTCPLKFTSALWKAKHFIGRFMTADDSIKCGCMHSGMTGQVRGFKNPKVCLRVFPSFFPHPLLTLLLATFFVWSLTHVPCSLLRNHRKCLLRRLSNLGFFYLLCRNKGGYFVKRKLKIRQPTSKPGCIRRFLR